MDEGGQLAAEYSSKQSKETQMAHKADRKLSNLAVHAEHGLLRAGLGRRAFEEQVGQPSQNRTQNRPPPKKKKEAHKTAHPNATGPKNRERQQRGGAGGEKQRQARKKKGRRKKDGEQGRRRAGQMFRIRPYPHFFPLRLPRSDPHVSQFPLPAPRLRDWV